MPRNAQEARRQSDFWIHFKRAAYDARVTIAETIPAMIPNGSRVPVGPTSSERSPIAEAAEGGIPSTYERGRAPYSAEVTPN